MAELVGHEDRRSRRLLDHRLKRLELGVVEVVVLPPVHHAAGVFRVAPEVIVRALDALGVGASIVEIDLAARHLKAFAQDGLRVDRLHLHALFERGVKLSLQTLVHRHRVGRQLHLDALEDGLLKVEPILRVDRDRQVGELRLDERVGSDHRGILHHVGFAARSHGLEVPHLVGRHGGAEALALVHEPRLPPEIDQSVRCGRARQLDEPVDQRVHAGEGFRSGRSAPQAEALEASGFVNHDDLERPRLAVLLHQPRELFEVRAHDVGFLIERPLALALIAATHRHAQVLQVVPLLHLIRPRAPSHAERGDDERGAFASEEHPVEGGKRGDCLPHTHARPHHAPLVADDMVDDDPLIRTRVELHGIFSTRAARRLAISPS